jgi:hypothetical protein
MRTGFALGDDGAHHLIGGSPVKRFAMKKIVVILGCMLVASLASDGHAATVKKKLHNTH